MDELNRAYELLGVTASMSLDEIEMVYDELVLKYQQEAKSNMYYQHKLEEWKKAYECILDDRLDELNSEEIASMHKIYPNSLKPPNQFGKEVKIGLLVSMIVSVILALIIANQIYCLKYELKEEEIESVVLNEEPLHWDNLANKFTLSLGNFNNEDDWDWAYYDNENEWIIIVALEVIEAKELGALVNLNNVHLESDYAMNVIPTDIYLDPDINQIHYLGTYSELIPKNHKFGVVFKVDPFYKGEERFIYYDYPDGRVEMIGSLYFESEQDENMIYVHYFLDDIKIKERNFLSFIVGSILLKRDVVHNRLLL